MASYEARRTLTRSLLPELNGSRTLTGLTKYSEAR
jgi:hypothetical protein